MTPYSFNRDGLIGVGTHPMFSVSTRQSRFISPITLSDCYLKAISWDYSGTPPQGSVIVRFANAAEIYRMPFTTTTFGVHIVPNLVFIPGNIQIQVDFAITSGEVNHPFVQIFIDYLGL